MTKTLSIVYAVILFISLFLVVQNAEIEFEGKLLFYTLKIYSFVTLLFVGSIWYCFINIILLSFFIDYYIECQRDADCPQLSSAIFAYKCILNQCKFEFIYQQAPFLLFSLN